MSCKSGRLKTKVRDVEAMAKVCMWLSDTPPRNGQVSGSEMLTNLKGSPYEKFSMWVCQRDKMRKYGQPATQKLVLSEKLGIDCGEPRLPIAPLSDAAKNEVLSGAKTFGMLTKASL